MNKPYFVRAEWDTEAGVWVATSDDVPGLVTEAETIEALDAKLKSMVPELLEANGCMPADGQVAVELLARRFSVTVPAAA
jgi:predicted RNase H-like HicB family nuclease